MADMKIKELEQMIGYTFMISKMLLSMRCATAPMQMSTVRDRCMIMRRLEFLGDAVLEVCEQ